jgi:ABC-2 type transport system ATP-binding protein
MLSAESLTKRYQAITALDKLTLTVQPGEVFCLLGANGAGKTTTINLFLNFVQPTSGTATINGIDVTKEPLETKKYLAYIPETVMLYKNLTGLENLEYFSALAGRPDYTRTQLLDFLTRVGLQTDAADNRVGTYSKGMRQKVGIAIALAKNAKALLLDEPTSGLDPKASNEFSALLARMSADRVAVADGHARPVPRQGIGHARRHHEARSPGADARHRRNRPRRSRTDLPGAHA